MLIVLGIEGIKHHGLREVNCRILKISSPRTKQAPIVECIHIFVIELNRDVEIVESLFNLACFEFRKTPVIVGVDVLGVDFDCAIELFDRIVKSLRCDVNESPVVVDVGKSF